jgi:hypothetical protein
MPLQRCGTFFKRRAPEFERPGHAGLLVGALPLHKVR